jgi:hypothetical protein
MRNLTGARHSSTSCPHTTESIALRHPWASGAGVRASRGHSDKNFALGYGEFVSDHEGDLESMALAVPTDALDGPPPAGLETLSTDVDGLFDAVRSGDWDAASAALESLGTAWEALSGDGRNDDRRDCGDCHQGEDRVEDPPGPPPPRRQARRASPAHEVCRASGRTLPHFLDRLVLSRRVPSTVLGLPPPSWGPATVPAIVGIHPPVGTSVDHRPIPQLLPPAPGRYVEQPRAAATRRYPAAIPP